MSASRMEEGGAVGPGFGSCPDRAHLAELSLPADQRSILLRVPPIRAVVRSPAAPAARVGQHRSAYPL